MSINCFRETGAPSRGAIGFFGLGVVYARRRAFDRAAEEWRRAVALRPDLADARANLENIERKDR